MMHVFMLHMYMIIDPDACVYDAPMYDAYVYHPRSLTLMSVSMMRYFSVTDEQGNSRSWIGSANSIDKM